MLVEFFFGQLLLLHLPDGRRNGGSRTHRDRCVARKKKNLDAAYANCCLRVHHVLRQLEYTHMEKHGSGCGGASGAATAGSSTLRPLDVSNMDVIFRGRVWSHSEDPTSKNVIHLLERDESIVTWLQPKGGSVEDQVARAAVVACTACGVFGMHV